MPSFIDDPGTTPEALRMWLRRLLDDNRKVKHELAVLQAQVESLRKGGESDDLHRKIGELRASLEELRVERDSYRQDLERLRKLLEPIGEEIDIRNLDEPK